MAQPEMERIDIDSLPARKIPLKDFRDIALKAGWKKESIQMMERLPLYNRFFKVGEERVLIYPPNK